MPELPEVETVVRALSKCLTGRRISRVDVLHKPSVSGSPQAPQCLSGQRVLRVFRRGKFIRIECESGLGMAVHLRMTGWLGVVLVAGNTANACVPKSLLNTTIAAKKPGAAHDPYLRVRFVLDAGSECLAFRDIRTFGRVWCGATGDLESLKALTKLGPEPLEISAAEFSERLRSRRGRLKALLLNQEFLAGVGNIYADESLHLAALHPLALARNVRAQSAKRLHAAIQNILLKSIEAGGSSIDDFLNPDGDPGWFQRELLAYGREGEKCARCEGIIKRIVMGQRGTWFCPKCQKRR